MTDLPENNIFQPRGTIVSKTIDALREQLLMQLPVGAAFEDDRWNCLAWELRRYRRRSEILDFAPIHNVQLRQAVKTWVLHSRFTQKIGCSAARLRIAAFSQLSVVLDTRPLYSLRTADFESAEKLLQKAFSAGTAARRCGELRSGAMWLSAIFGLSIDYTSRIRAPAAHGRGATDSGRESKLISDQVLADLLRNRGRQDLHPSDSFFLDVLVVEMGTGFRISELFTLPADCLMLENNATQILHLPAKDGVLIPRLVPSRLASAVTTAVKTIIARTQSSRIVLKKFRDAPPLDWRSISSHDDATRYFVGKWVAEWIADPNHRLINPGGAWCNSTERYYDVEAAIEASHGNKSAAANQLGINRRKLYQMLEDQRRAQKGLLPAARNRARPSDEKRDWDVDKRAISIERLNAATGLKWAKNSAAVETVRVGLNCQLDGCHYDPPAFNSTMEAAFRRSPRVVVRGKDGKPLLWEDDALFVLPRFALASKRGRCINDPEILTPRDFNSWLTGAERSKGTGKQEASVFERLKIVDERSGKVASFTAHDVRHWLNTIYQKGGLTDDQIALIFNRRSAKQNRVYDQTSTADRSERMRAAIRGKFAVGRISESYHRLVADFSREEAEKYLEAATRLVSPMPHGACTLNWSSTPCPHHMSCFSCESEAPTPCNFLLIDARSPSEIHEIERIAREAKQLQIALIEQGIEDSPMYRHAARVENSATLLLSRCGGLNESG